MKRKLLIIALLLLFVAVAAKADNPPLPCNTTWQQNGFLRGCDLYQGSHPLPRNPWDCWKFRCSRPGYGNSYGWYQLECGTPPVHNAPLDGYDIWAVILVAVLAGLLGFFGGVMYERN